MTECCGKISMSLLERDARASTPLADQLATVCTSGRPFRLQNVRVVTEAGAEVVPGSGEVGRWMLDPSLKAPCFQPLNLRARTLLSH